MLVLTTTAHFNRRRRDLVAMVPPGLPHPGLLITVTGVLEGLAAVGLALPATARWAAACLALLLIAMFPANVHAARVDAGIGRRPATPLPVRTLIQVLFVAACVVVVV